MKLIFIVLHPILIDKNGIMLLNLEFVERLLRTKLRNILSNYNIYTQIINSLCIIRLFYNYNFDFIVFNKD